MRKERKAVARSMKLACRKKKRILKRAVTLTDGDLIEVMRMRAEKIGNDAAMTTSPPTTQENNED